MTDPLARHVAADLLAAMSDTEAAAFVAEARNPERTRQLSRDDLARMTPAEIEAARVAGRFDTLLGVPTSQLDLIARATAHGPVARADLAELNRLGRHDLAASYAAHLDQITD